ncbi:exonuclease domain-containing protein [Micromonospora sp. NBC_00858]|uniref:exonuclease domain-containing protein n=1 Tax=Micromonospora sp. NBC_00858 TaxID=2975979 RepID=UPI00386828D8|nr:exonuclease domain-containing protein [Micromonospora sp. NBC_00858]
MGILDRIRGRLSTTNTPPLPRQPSDAGQHTAPFAPPVGGFAVVDVETTGLVASRDRVVEVAVIATDPFGRVVDEWTTLVNPGGPVGATKIHGITAGEVRRAPRFAELIGEMNARLAGRALVAHNARFDLGFLGSEYERAGWAMPTCPHLCTFEASWIYLPRLDRRRLSDCCWATGIRLDNAHSALGDARATATLLMSYLDRNFGRPPEPDHLHLPAHAAEVTWPVIPRQALNVTLRRPAGPTPVPAETGLAALLDDLPLSSAIEEGAPTNTTGYLELLAEVLEDGVLTDDEAASLAGLAKTYSLSREQVDAAHRGFLLALAHKAIEDGKVTRDERQELLAAAQAIGFTDGIVKAVLDEARTALAEQRGKGCLPLPDSWLHGEPLRIGEGVAFTGCDELLRARLEGRAQAAGLRVTGSVSRKTAVLVTDGVDPYTTKAQAAREFKTRIVTPEVFAELVHYVQPAKTEAATRTPAITVPSPTPATTARMAATTTDSTLPASGPTIRAWARANGLPVGVRGRLATEIVNAYAVAHRLDMDPTGGTAARNPVS